MSSSRTLSGRSVYHEGELEAQERSGTSEEAEELKGIISEDLSLGPGLGTLFKSLRVAFITSVEHGVLSTNSAQNDVAASGLQVWVSMAFGPQGFVHAPDSAHLEIDFENSVPQHDVLWQAIQRQPPSDPTPIGFLAIDFLRRRRYRVNGRAALIQNGTVLSLHVSEAFGNCPKYIQSREMDPATSQLTPLVSTANSAVDFGPRLEKDSTSVGARLTYADRDLIARADTFILGTYHPDIGADTSHRGGHPGFVRVLSDSELLWPDYKGNGMFQSLGNILRNCRAGLCFFDFETGEILQLTGTVRLDWNTNDPSLETGTTRTARFSVDQSRRSRGPVTNYRWHLVERSPYNPELPSTSSVVMNQARGDSGSKTSFPLEAALVSVSTESPLVNTFKFEVSKPVHFLAGQYATIVFDDVPEIRATPQSPVIRTWTLTRPPMTKSGASFLYISVKRKERGLVSSWLHDTAMPGVRIKVLGIAGDMTLYRPVPVPRELVCISGGIGITPNMAILRSIRENSELSSQTNVVFLYQERNKKLLLFQKELKEIVNHSEGRVKVLNFVTQGESKGDEANELHNPVNVGRIDMEQIRTLVPNLSGRMIYLCGPTGFMQAIVTGLVGLGVNPAAIVTEYFF